jgi:sec-independent protein translocase protein TatA
MFNLGALGTKEVIILVLIIVILFGARRIPDLAKGIADAIKILRGGFKSKDDK